MPSSTSSSEPPAGHRARRGLIALAGAIAGFFALGIAAWQAVPFSPVSEQRYLAAVEDHLAMLEASRGEEGRIVLVGGSGTAFSVSAEHLAQELGRPVYNGGIQASIGVRNLIDLYLPRLDPERDLIVLLVEPELLVEDERHSQTWCDVIYLRKDLAGLAARPRCLPNILDRTWQELRHHASGSRVTDPVYRRSAFNARGDVTAHLALDRPAPDLSDYRFPPLDKGEIERFSAYVEDELAGRGFALAYVPAAIPATACERSQEQVLAFHRALGALTSGGPVMKDIAAETGAFCLAPDLFFDGAGHLGAAGRALHTGNVAGHIRRFLARGEEAGRAALAPGGSR
ncbi:hypothetical protein [Erythrobacter sp. HL-111]|uniref:hypothetical protein n=1 Tax=Erythrobacter sp. HL-111 TaxID=1798193 RepID=UPI0006D9DF3E|nr:hypothetical protein [Erythrobacter sp. HL-111]KPP95473.1 MAG: Anti-sigma-K factor rskA [Erythrobacteraceae bacterium HL-111]SDS72222.1 hypothetical protein SAMN04515621_2101 [Erythrobacter sp. HL-111]